MARPRPTVTPPPPGVAALGVAVLVLAVIATSSWLSSGDLRRDLRIARAELVVAQQRASELAADVADLRRELQSRQGAIEDLTDRADELASELASAQGIASEATDAAAAATQASAEASEQAAAARDLAEVTTLISSTPDVTRAIHVTDVVDGDVLVGFDLREMLSDGPRAGDAVQVRLALTNAPRPGDCRHTQSVGLVRAWLQATDNDVLLRRPEGAPTTDALGRQVAEVLAFTNPSSSLNVTMVVAGEAILDEPTAAQDPGLLERLRVAQSGAEALGAGVWGCAASALLGTGTLPPEPTPTPTPVPTGGTPPPADDDG